MASSQQTVRSLSFFRFMVNLEQSENWIPDAQPVKVILPLTVTFYLTKTENRLKISNTVLTLLLSVKLLFLQKMLIFYKKVLTSPKL